MLLSVLATNVVKFTCVPGYLCLLEDYRPSSAVEVTFAQTSHCRFGTCWRACPRTSQVCVVLVYFLTVLIQIHLLIDLTPSVVSLICVQNDWFWVLADFLKLSIFRLVFRYLFLIRSHQLLSNLNVSNLLWLFKLWLQTPPPSSIDLEECGTALTAAQKWDFACARLDAGTPQPDRSALLQAHGIWIGSTFWEAWSSSFACGITKQKLHFRGFRSPSV